MIFSARHRLPAFISAACLLLLAACGSEVPSSTAELIPQPVESFDTAMNVTESDLSDLRGGFAAPGGFNISFGLSTSTLVDGAIISSFSISGNNFSKLTPQNLQQIVQVGANNSFNGATPTTLNNSIVTLIQNNVNNVTIQNSNVLSVNVSNLSSYRNQQAIFNSFSPLIRSIH